MATLSFSYQYGTETNSDFNENEDEEVYGRLLSLEEFIDRICSRPDIFSIDSNTGFRATEYVAMLLAVIVGILVNTQKPEEVQSSDWGVAPPEKSPVGLTISRVLVERPRLNKQVNTSTIKKILSQSPDNTAQNGKGKTGVGTARSRVTKKGVLGFLSNRIITHKSVAGEMSGLVGMAEGLDAIISGTVELKRGGTSVIGHRGADGIGFAAGYGSSGFGGPDMQSTSDLIDQIMQPSAQQIELATRQRAPPDFQKLIAANADIVTSAAGTRTKSSIAAEVINNLIGLRYAYSQRLREKPELKGKITVKFAINELGEVVRCEIIESTINDRQLETTVLNKIARWHFEKIDNPEDITEIIYPFMFST